jgi:hypothetical protein
MNKTLIDDVICRFLLNIPTDELKPPRLFLNIQDAQWFY